ncbi:MAG TPA: NnrU family protein [Lacibacter sp.]|nr:NnrU family protein [Lacibacter sp.]HMO89904.1 NnrU family protein [Lacibacter sp.]HMP85989.1 NnrU family protein [Lacibacter sp.]
MILLLLAWFLFYFLHSLLAATAVKAWLLHRLPACREPRYRLFYNLFAGSTLLAALWVHRQTDSPLLYQPGTGHTVAAICLLAAGAGVLLAAFRNFRLRSFAGLEREDYSALVTGGIHRLIRHPLYTGTALLLLGWCLQDPLLKNFLLLALTLLYIGVGSRLEEHKLLQLYGEAYRQYRQQVPAFLPHLFGLLLILQANQYPV